jgi:anthranilate synthase component 2
VEKESLPDSLQVDAESDDAMIMALSHRTRPIYGVQFHPESYGSRGGEQIVRNFLKMAGVR